MSKTITLNTQEAVKQAETELVSITNDSRIVVSSKPTLEKAIDQLKEVKRVKKLIKEKKDSVIKPLNEALKNARALFKPSEDKIDTIESYLKDQTLKYNQKLLAEQKAREEEAQKKIEQGESFEKATKKVENTTEKINTIRTRKVKKLRIIDANKIPIDYMIPNEREILAAWNKGLSISGTEVYEEEIPVNSY